MTTPEDQAWEDALHDACFPVTLTDVYVGNPSRLAKRYRAVVPVDGEPFAIVTDRYRLIRNEDVIDLGHEAFERLFGPQQRARMSVFNVVMANGKGSFLADFTAPDLGCSIPVPGNHASAVDPDGDPTRHTFFLRTVNSYNRTQAVRLEAGICRWICRNGMIFGKQSIQFRDPHHWSEKCCHQLIDLTTFKLECPVRVLLPVLVTSGTSGVLASPPDRLIVTVVAGANPRIRGGQRRVAGRQRWIEPLERVWPRSATSATGMEARRAGTPGLGAEHDSPARRIALMPSTDEIVVVLSSPVEVWRHHEVRSVLVMRSITS